MSRDFTIIYRLFRDISRNFFNKLSYCWVIRIRLFVCNRSAPLRWVDFGRWKGQINNFSRAKGPVFQNWGTFRPHSRGSEVCSIGMIKFATF